MELNKNEFLKEYNIDEKFLIDNNIDWNELEKIYNDYSMYRKSYETQANLIANILREHKKVHSVKARVKDENHLIEKIIRKTENRRRKYGQDFNFTVENYKDEITDLVGIRVIHIFKEDWEEIHNFITKMWNVNEIVANIRKGEKRLDTLEKKIESGDIKVNNTKSAEPKQTMSARQTNTSNDKTENKPKASIANITSTEYWPKVVNNLKNKGKLTLFTNLMNTKAVELNDMQIGIVGLTAFGKTVVEQPDNRQEITKAILQEAGKEMQIKVEEVQNVINRTQNQNFGIPINIIEE